MLTLVFLFVLCYRTFELLAVAAVCRRVESDPIKARPPDDARNAKDYREEEEDGAEPPETDARAQRTFPSDEENSQGPRAASESVRGVRATGRSLQKAPTTKAK